MGKIFFGLALMALGIVMVIKSEAIYSFFGPIAFFEKYLGTEGGSRLGWKLIGLLAFFIGMLLFTGLFDGFIYWMLSPLINMSGGGVR